MKQLLLLLALFPFFFSCNPEEDDSMPPEAIELDDVAWNYTEKSSLIRYAGTPVLRDIFVKIDGVDGSYLYLTLPREYLDSIPSMPYAVKGRAAYYPNSNTFTEWPLEGPATIQLLEIEANTQVLRLSFEALVSEVNYQVGGPVIQKYLKSGEISAIGFKEVNGFASSVHYEIRNDQNEWHVSKFNSDMQGGQVNWFFFNTDSFPMSTTMRLTIPWGQALGTTQIESGYHFLRALSFETGIKHWFLESGELTLEENDFKNAKQKGHFKGVFYHPDFPDQKFHISEGRFEVSFQP